MTANGAAKPILGLIGGAGTLGMGLALRWARAGYPIIIGSRDPARAVEAARSLPVTAGCPTPQGASYAEAAASADFLILTIPFSHQAAVIDTIMPSLHGQLVLDTTVPLMPDSKAVVHLPEIGSAALTAQQRFGDAARVVSALHNVPAKKLRANEHIDCDVLVFGDSVADREAVIALITTAGLRGVHGGPLANAVAAEALASVLIGVNQHYNINNAGLQITGLP